MSKYYTVAKEKYDKGHWNKEMLENLVKLGRITRKECKEIIGGSKNN